MAYLTPKSVKAFFHFHLAQMGSILLYLGFPAGCWTKSILAQHQFKKQPLSAGSLFCCVLNRMCALSVMFIQAFFTQNDISYKEVTISVLGNYKTLTLACYMHQTPILSCLPWNLCCAMWFCCQSKIPTRCACGNKCVCLSHVMNCKQKLFRFLHDFSLCV